MHHDTGHRHNWANYKWQHATCRYMSHLMSVPQNVQGDGCFCRYFTLAALRISSSSTSSNTRTRSMSRSICLCGQGRRPVVNSHRRGGQRWQLIRSWSVSGVTPNSGQIKLSKSLPPPPRMTAHVREGRFQPRHTRTIVHHRETVRIHGPTLGDLL